MTYHSVSPYDGKPLLSFAEQSDEPSRRGESTVWEAVSRGANFPAAEQGKAA